MSKSKVTDIISVAIIAISYQVPNSYHEAVLLTGLFALSGAVTNQLAIYMLFERVPFLYGSGAIEKNFEKFKASIHEMVMTQFFNNEHLGGIISKSGDKMDIAKVIEDTDFSPAFDALKQSVMESKLGSMLQMFGGEEALEPLRDTFSVKLKKAVAGIVSSEAFMAQLSSSTISEKMIDTIESIVASRLDELTPSMVKDLVKRLIHDHLGWLVVWGGVFGGIIGFASSFVL